MLTSVPLDILIEKEILEVTYQVLVMGVKAKGSYCIVVTEFLFGLMKKYWKWVVIMAAQYYAYNELYIGNG